MKRIVLFLLLCGLPLLDFAQDSLDIRNDCFYRFRQFDSAYNLCNDNPCILVFEDDFIGHGLDKSVWTTKLLNRAHLRPGNEQQYYNFNGNYEVANGKLYLVAKILDPAIEAIADPSHDENDTLSDGILNKRTFKYSSCNIETKRKFSFGKFEARVKLPKGKGFWPAFWLLNPGPRYNELDIFEFWNEYDGDGHVDTNKLSKVHLMTSHFENVGQSCPGSENYGIDFSKGYNDFCVDWNRNNIAWYVNGIQKRKRFKIWLGLCNVIKNFPYLVDITQPEDAMYLILNLAIQGNNNIISDSPDDNTPFPSKLQVDWVRVWYRMNMGDVSITAPTQCILDDELFNAVTGTNVTIDCDCVVPRGQQLSLSASDNVILKSGFVAEAGSVFNARSKQPVYDDRFDKNLDDNEDYFKDLVDDSDEDQIAREDLLVDGFHISTNGSYSISNGLYVYPNPNNGVFRVQLPSSVSGKCSVSITDLNGHLAFATETDGAENLTIDISSLPKGIYLLHLVSFYSEYYSFQKIIIL